MRLNSSYKVGALDKAIVFFTLTGRRIIAIHTLYPGRIHLTIITKIVTIVLLMILIDMAKSRMCCEADGCRTAIVI